MAISAQLDYAPAPPKRIRRGAVLLMFIAEVVFALKSGPAYWRKARILYWQNQCMNYTAPADQVVYEEEPAAAAKLLAVNTEYSPHSINRQKVFNHAAAPVKAAALTPDRLKEFDAIGLRPSLGFLLSGGATIFLHERTSPAGNKRLVCVIYRPTDESFNTQFISGYNVEPYIIIPAGTKTMPTAVQSSWSIDVMSGWPKGSPPNVRIYAGQIDPNDSSHFTIRYQIWGQEDVLDGRLNDRDQITLTPRKIPEEPR